VGAGARAGLKDIERKVRIVLARCHLRCRTRDGHGKLGVEQAQIRISRGRGLLDERERTDKSARHAIAADGEILCSALSLCSPERFGGDLQFPHAIAFETKRGGGHTDAPIWLVLGSALSSV